MAKPRGKMVEMTCLYCSQTFSVRDAEVKRGNGKYCSREHHFAHRPILKALEKITPTRITKKVKEYA